MRNVEHRAPWGDNVPFVNVWRSISASGAFFCRLLLVRTFSPSPFYNARRIPPSRQHVICLRPGEHDNRDS